MYIAYSFINLLWGNDETSYLNAFVLNDLFAYNKKLEKKKLLYSETAKQLFERIYI